MKFKQKTQSLKSEIMKLLPTGPYFSTHFSFDSINFCALERTLKRTVKEHSKEHGKEQGKETSGN